MSSITVLVGVAGDTEARIERYADVLTMLSEAGALRVTLAHVYAEDDVETIEKMYDIDSRDRSQIGAAAEHNTTVQNLMDELSERGIEYTTTGAVGNASTELISLAREVDADFVLVGGRKRSPTGKVLFGSTAQHVLMNAPCPVIFAKS